MAASDPGDRIERASKVASGVPGLRLLLLHGSRARGDAHADSDWDFAFLGDAGLDVAGLAHALADAVGSEDVDLADLGRAGAVLRHGAARDGVLVHERHPGEHERFWTEAVRFWCDAQPLIDAGVRDVLRGLGP